MLRTRHVSLLVMLPPRPPRVAAVLLAVLAVACGDPTKPQATFPSFPASYVVYAFTGAPVNAATAISFLDGPARADAGFAFDVAVDLNAQGRPVVYPVGVLASDLARTDRRVGLQVIPGPFDAVREVPATGYDTLTARTVNPQDVLAVEMLDFARCRFSLGGQTLYAKLTVDSVNTTTRRVYLRAVVDQNCGYRSVVPDSIPEI